MATATQTDFLNLELPAGSDYYNVGVTNSNSLKIDNYAKNMQTFFESLSANQIAYLNAAMPDVTELKAAVDWLSAKKVNIETPTEYDIPFVSGISNGGGGRSLYWKNQLGEVAFTVAGVSSDAVQYAQTIATLPVGFRPKNTRIYNASYSISGVRSGGGSLNITSTGNIVYYGDSVPAGATFFGAGTFVSAI